jgi:molybdopterin synthase catalytic subunit
MSLVKLSVHRALAEIKLLNKRIESGCNVDFLAANTMSNVTIKGKSLEDYKKLITGNYDSVTTLIENRKRIKSALVISNATTKVKIGDQEFFVAEAIERKNAIDLEKLLLSNLKQQYNVCNKTVNDNATRLPEMLEKYLSVVLGTDKNTRDPESVKAHTKDFEKRNKMELIDPLNIATKIEQLEKSIDNFETNVDYVLSESNATTFIEIELKD